MPQKLPLTKKPDPHPNSLQNNKCLRKSPSTDQFLEQHEICQKNTKILKDSYGKYLKELEGTNIIKWRILSGEGKEGKEVGWGKGE